VRKLITAAMEEGADGDWTMIETMYVSLVGRLSRNPGRDLVTAVLDDMQLLRDEIVNLLERQLNSENMSGNAGQSDHHIQNSNTESSHELEPRFEQKQDVTEVDKPKPASVPIRTYPLGMVLKACPQIADYGPGGGIASWRDLMSAAVVVRSMLGVSPSAYQDACEAMGPENAAATMACILERAGQINSAGGYLRDLTAKARRDEFSLGPVIMALLRANAPGEGRRFA
jgi:replication initiation protein RepC